MSLLANIVNWFRGKKFFAYRFGVREVIPDIDATKAIVEGFNDSAAIYTIVNDDAQKFASIPRYLYDAKKYDKGGKLRGLKIKAANEDTLLNNDLSKLLARPNPYQGQTGFLMAARAFYKVTGEAFIWLNRGELSGKDSADDLKPVLEMYVLPSNRVDVISDPEDMWGVAGYLLDTGGQKMPLRKSDVIHWKALNLEFDPISKRHLRGMSPLKPGAATMQENKDSSHAAVRMYQNDGAKGVIYNESFNNLSPEQRSQVENVINRKINNHDIKGAVATLAGKWGYLNFGGTSVDMDLIKGRGMTWKELCALLGVPYEFYNTETTFANKEQAQKGWVSNKIIPACKEFDDELNRGLLRAFKLEGIGIIASDFMELPELQDDMKMLTEWLSQSEELTPNERRIAKGYEPRPEKEFDEPWMSNNKQPLSRILEEQDDGFQDLMRDIINPTNGKLNGQKKPEAVKN